MDTPGADRPDRTYWYEIRLQGRLGPRWSAWLAEMTVTDGPADTTVLNGPVLDQAALHGLLARVRDLGLPLLSLVRVESPAPSDPSTSPSQGD